MILSDSLTLTWTSAGSIPMRRHLWYLQAIHFFLSSVTSQSVEAGLEPALLLHLSLSRLMARRLKKARQE